MGMSKFTHRVMVQQLTAVSDAGGGNARNWNDFREVWAHVKWGLVGRDAGNGGLGRRRRVIITLRWAPDLPDPMRLVISQKKLLALSLTRINAPGHDLLEVVCEDTF